MIASLWGRQLLPLLLLLVVVVLLAGGSCQAAFLTPSATAATKSSSTTQLNDWFDNRFGGQGSASKSDLDDQWEAQQEILRARRAPQSERDQYFRKVEERRAAATTKQTNMWSWTNGKNDERMGRLVI
jgi:predicted ribosome quality control (RQC) complex YloA/Tae2 family protein